jgi:thiol:disulfide interchange protein DsbD
MSPATLARALGAILVLGTALPAFSSGSASPAPPPPPTVDFASVAKSAAVRPTNADDKPHQVLTRLITDKTSVKPGETFRLGLHLTQDPQWHTYWKAPGDIGLPTDITWKLPDGATATAYQYPVPQRFELAEIVSFGYDGTVLLHTEVTVSPDAKPGPIELGASAAWLVCKEQCIPGEVELSMPFEVSAEGGTASPVAPLFTHFEAQHPTPLDKIEGLSIETVLSHDAVQADNPFSVAYIIKGVDGHKVTASTDHLWPVFTPIPPGGEWGMIGADENGKNIVEVKVVGDTIVAHMAGEVWERPEGDTVVGGLFQVEIDGKKVATEVIYPLTWKPAGEALTVSKHPVWAQLGGGSASVSGGGGGEGHATADAIPVDDIGSAKLSDADCTALLGGEGATKDSGIGTMLWMLGMAFVGGLILNIMPCVLPVLTLKLYSLIEQVDIDQAEQKKAGLAYTAGILASYLALAIVVLVMQIVLGQNIGWGFQFQYPPYVAALATLVFVFGLSLFGVFELPALGADSASQAADKEGVVGYFMTGVFATLLATPCSAPFLGTAIGFAFSQPAAIVVVFFLVAGLGLASPFLLIAWVPALFKLMPQPGAWMDTFKQLMGFSLIATTLWLVSVLSSQITLGGLIGFLVFLATTAVSAWIFGNWGGLGASGLKQIGALVVAVLVSIGGGMYWLDMTPAMHMQVDGEGGWRAFSPAARASLLNRYRGGEDPMFKGKAAFLDFTAEWCLSCKVNEKTVLASESVEAAFAKNDVVKIKADWTNRDEDITDWLKCFGAGGVPFYAVIPAEPGVAAIPLGEVVSPSGVIQALEDASAEQVGLN